MIYFDNAATTSVSDFVVDRMIPFMKEQYGNPSAAYKFSGVPGRALYGFRQTLADVLNADADEIYFTSGGTESDNLSIFGVCEYYSFKGKHIISTAIEHKAVLNPLKKLEKLGYSVTYVQPDENGVIRPSDIEAAVRNDTILISVMAANNETGVIQPLEEIGRIAAAYGIIFHTDAVQAFAHIGIDVRRCNISLLSASAHKIGGPRGVGLLFKDRDIRLAPQILGGGQEQGLRSGTENVAGAAGFAAAVEQQSVFIRERCISTADYVRGLRDRLYERLFAETDGLRLNGQLEDLLPSHLNISIDNVRGDALLLRLSSKDICVSTGSACTSRDGEPSYVLRAMGRSDEECDSSIRISLSANNTIEEVDTFSGIFADLVKELRSMRL